MGKHLIQTGAVRDHRSRQVAQIPVPEETQRQFAKSLSQTDPPAGAFLISSQIQRRILEIVQYEQHRKHQNRHPRIYPPSVHGIFTVLQDVQKILNRRHNDSHREHQADVADKAPEDRFNKVSRPFLTERKYMLQSVNHLDSSFPTFHRAACW